MQTNSTSQTKQEWRENSAPASDQVIHALLEQIQARDQKLTYLTQELQQLQDQVGKLNTTSADHSALLVDRNLIYTQMVSTSAERDALKAEIAVLQSKTKALNLEIADFKSQQYRLNYTLQNVLRSKSWRFTSGFRHTGLLIRKLLTLNTQIGDFTKAIVWKITGKYPHPFRRLAQIRLLKSNPAYVDHNFYYTQNPDLAALNLNAVEHYYDYGSFEGRDPNPNFDTSFYLDYYPDVSKSGLNPLWHYIQYGQQESRLTKPAATVVINLHTRDANYPVTSANNSSNFPSSPLPDVSTDVITLMARVQHKIHHYDPEKIV